MTQREFKESSLFTPKEKREESKIFEEKKEEAKSESKEIKEKRDEVERKETEENKTEELKNLKTQIEKITEEKEKEEEEKEERKKELIIREILKEEVPEEMRELIGDDSESGWEEREKLFSENPKAIVKTLAGITSERTKKFIRKHKIPETQELWRPLCLGLIDNDSNWAWEIRKELLRQKEREQIIESESVKIVNWFHEIIKKFTGERPDGPTAWRWQAFLQKTGLYKSELFYKFRKIIDNMKFSPGWFLPGDVVISTTGLDSKKAWELRKQFLEKTPAEVLISLRGNSSKEANEIREKFEDDKRLKWAIKESLKGAEF